MHDPTLRADLAAHYAAHPGEAYPDHLRQRAVRCALALRAAGATWEKVATQVGVSGTTLQHWSKLMDAPATFVPVVVTDHGPSATSVAVAAAAKRPTPRTFCLVSPRGFRVDGLELGDVTQILGQLG